MSRLLKKEDYEEPRCVICDPATGMSVNRSSIPMQRVSEKLDEFCNLKDFDGAERFLKYWLEEAKTTGDIRGEFGIRNEMMGFYRKQGKYDEAVESVKEATKLMNEMGIENSLSGGTCHVNCGTVFDSFSMPEEALVHFEKAGKIFEAIPNRDDYKTGSLYNNMALALAELERFPEAMESCKKAIEIMKNVSGAELEVAVSYLNMADAAALWKGIDEVSEETEAWLLEAKRFLDTESLPRDGYYAFICERCAPGFNCYGKFDWAEEIQARADEIYKKLKEA